MGRDKMQRLVQGVLVAAMLVALAACQNTSLRKLEKPGEGPDEFRIVPVKALQSPTDLNALPTPTPGGSNLTDQNPLSDSIVALGGRAPATSTSIPSSDAGLVNEVSRFGRDGNIRATLAAEDEDFRRRRGRFTQIRIVRTDSYSEVYRRQALDPFRETTRWRQAGARTPSAPPGQ